MTTCFYCNDNLNTIHGSLSQRTRDHIYPIASKPTPAHGIPNWKDLNVVYACAQCNAYKGHLHPLDWLVIMPNHRRSKVLARRLIQLGEVIEEVEDALRRRKPE